MSIEEQRRARFEAAYKAEVEAQCPGAFTPEVFARKASDGEYLIGPVQCAWWGWNKALDGATLDLSTLRISSRPGFTGSERVYVSDVTELCAAVGLKVKL